MNDNNANNATTPILESRTDVVSTKMNTPIASVATVEKIDNPIIIGFNGNPTYESMQRIPDPPELKCFKLKSDRHNERIKVGFVNDIPQYENFIPKLFEEMKSHNWYELVKDWIDSTRLSNTISFLPQQYINSRIPANVNLTQNFGSVAFSAEVTYDRAWKANEAAQATRFRGEDGSTYEVVEDTDDEDDKIYDECMGFKPMIPDSGKNLYCILTMKDMYEICFKISVYSMFDLGFQIEKLVRDECINIHGLKNSFLNYCPCAKWCAPFLHKHGIHEIVTCQFRYQVGENQDGFCKNNKLMSNEVLYQHLKDKGKECYVHYLIWYYLDVYYYPYTDNFFPDVKK